MCHPVRKATRFASTYQEVLRQLSSKCRKDHVHLYLLDGRAKAAALDPPELCRATIRGMEHERIREGHVIPTPLLNSLESSCALYSLEVEQVELEDGSGGDFPHEQEATRQWYENEGIQFWDGVSGERLPAGLVQTTRQEEIQFMESWGVWEETSDEQCRAKTGKPPLDGRWVDANKGDPQHPTIRCRYVAKDLALTKTGEFFVAMPPLEALRMLITFVASGRVGGKGGGRGILIIDARKAHLHAFADRDVFVRLPPEIRQKGSMRMAPQMSLWDT